MIYLSSLLDNLYSTRRISIFFLLIINTCLIIDVAIGTTPEFIPEIIHSQLGVITFILITGVTIFGQIYLQKFAEKDNQELFSKSVYLSNLSKINKISCYILIANLIAVIVSFIIFTAYSTINLLLGNIISCFIGSFLLGSFGFKFIIWYMENRNSVTTLLYGLGFIIFAFSNFIIFTSDNFLIIEKPLVVTINMPTIYPEIEDNIFGIILKYYIYLMTTSFLFLLFASYLLLSHYSEQINRLKLIFSLTIVFIIYMVGHLNAFDIMEISIREKDLFYYYIFQSLIYTLGGVIFGFAFWKVANKLDPSNPIRKFLITSAIGFIIIYTVTQSTVIATPYPPYGLPSLSFIIVSIYLLNFGLYSSAISLSHDIQLRNKIRTLTVNKTGLLGNIGQAQMTQELQKAILDVKDIVEKEEQELKEKTGIESSITKDNVENYMEQVLNEIMASKNRRVNPNS